MRNQFAQAIIDASADPRLVFLSGDLGFAALEGVRDALGERFINAGIAEQNMVSVAAGLARKGFRPWVYSITPFATLRPYEQIRNDVCLHQLPVTIVGNGGGYGYGIMGSTHHALEDIGSMRLLPSMQVYVPCFGSDVKQAVSAISQSQSPAYLRLNSPITGTAPQAFEAYRTLSTGNKAVVMGCGPVLASILHLLPHFEPGSLEVVAVGKFPLEPLPIGLVEKLRRTQKLVTIEEHYAAGGLGEALASCVLESNLGSLRFLKLAAKGYPSGRYGSQAFHLKENGLAGLSLQTALEDFFR